MFFYFGWNQASYTKSDIRFTGDDFDFVLHDVKAVDRQTPFDFDPYFHPTKLTIPQTNMRLGYYITDNIQVSIGDDHMKYVMKQDQEVLMQGSIDRNSIYDGTYDQMVKLSESFLRYEHTDGLNYLNIEVNMTPNLDSLFRIRNDWLSVQGVGGGGIGMMYPKTNCEFLGQPRYDEFNVAGWGLSLKTGLEFRLWETLLIVGNIKGGYIHMPNVRITQNSNERARQAFYFFQSNFAIGVMFKLF